MKNRGFTLIELLVVVAIIGLLSSIVLAAVSTARVGANNAKFSEEMKSLVNALALYKSNNGNIPGQGAGWGLPNTTDGYINTTITTTGLDNTLSSLITDKDISKIPHYNTWVSGSLVAVLANTTYLTNNTGASPYNYSCSSISSDQSVLGVIAIVGAANLGLKLPKQDVWRSDDITKPYFANSSGVVDVYCLPINF
jgi:prepilin-type N-terminal cleavage/methylation domain-containing protein